MIFKIFSPKNLAKILAFLSQNKASFCKNCDRNIGFWEKRQFFRRKWVKIAENCDHNIDPRWVREKIAKNIGPAVIVSKYMLIFPREKNVAKNLTYFCSYQTAAKSNKSLNLQKIALSGHPVKKLCTRRTSNVIILINIFWPKNWQLWLKMLLICDKSETRETPF
jgi:hypothetical protein